MDFPRQRGRVILITHEFEPFLGGVATYCRELAAASFCAGRVIEVWAPDYHQTSSLLELPFPVVRLRSGGKLRFRDQWQFARELFQRRQELKDASVILGSVGAHLAFMFLLNTGLMKVNRLTSLLHGSEILRFRKNVFWRGLANRLFSKADCAVTTSQFCRSLFEQSPFSKRVTHVVIARGAPGSSATRARHRTSHHADDGTNARIRILTLARIHRRKGHLDTARALALLPAELRRRIVFQVAGTGDQNYLQRVENFCRDAGVMFYYLGPIAHSALAATYQQCDIYAMTSRTLRRSVEGFGISYLEASYHGKPIVAYHSGGVSEAVLHNQTGLLVEDGDIDAIAAAFERLCADPSLRRRFGEQGRLHAQSFHWSAAAAQVWEAAGARSSAG